MDSDFLCHVALLHTVDFATETPQNGVGITQQTCHICNDLVSQPSF
jgi:hypothetical protein